MPLSWLRATATSIIAALTSTPHTWPRSPTTRASSRASSPVPHPTSSTRSPGLSDSSSITCRFSLTTSGSAFPASMNSTKKPLSRAPSTSVKCATSSAALISLMVHCVTLVESICSHVEYCQACERNLRYRRGASGSARLARAEHIRAGQGDEPESALLLAAGGEPHLSRDQAPGRPRPGDRAQRQHGPAPAHHLPHHLSRRNRPTPVAGRAAWRDLARERAAAAHLPRIPRENHHRTFERPRPRRSPRAADPRDRRENRV